jgi:hypothetical protein
MTQPLYLCKFRSHKEEPFITLHKDLKNIEPSDLVCDYDGVKTWEEFIALDSPIGEQFVTDIFIIEKIK